MEKKDEKEKPVSADLQSTKTDLNETSNKTVYLENIEEGILNQFPTIVCLWLCAIYLSFPNYSWLHATLGIIFMYFWIHTIHRLLHEIPTDGIFGILNTHMTYHHQSKEKKSIPRWLELILETATDLSMNLLLFLIQYVLNVNIVPPIVVLFFTLTYMSVHIFNYSIIGTETHKRHHTSVNKNFGPDTIDHIMGTNFDDSWENTTHTIPNAIVIAILLQKNMENLPSVFWNLPPAT